MPNQAELPFTAEAEVPEQRLCLECGLCCRGVLHHAADLLPEEVDRARSLGLTVLENGGPAFRLPCPLFAHQRCGIYPDHPHTCRQYACLLLRRLRAGEITEEQARQHVTVAHALLESILARLPASDPGESVWTLAPQGGVEGQPVDGLLLADLASLDFYCRRYFGLRRGPAAT